MDHCAFWSDLPVQQDDLACIAPHQLIDRTREARAALHQATGTVAWNCIGGRRYRLSREFSTASVFTYNPTYDPRCLCPTRLGSG
jgi:hypothetical protein